MQQFTNGPLTFDVDDGGPADGDVVVLLHGYPENRTSWHAVTPLLTEAGYRVLAPDQRGYSPGARPPRRRDYRTNLLADDVVALADAAGAQAVHVVGHDWGGAVAWATASLHPDRCKTVTSLCTPHPKALIASMVRSSQLLRSWYMLVFQLPALPELMLRGAGAAAAKRKLIATGLPAEAADRYLAPLVSDPKAARAALNWYRALPLSPPLRGSIAVPALYVYPTADAFLGRKAADLTGRYVSAPYRYEVLDGRSHWLPEEAPDEVAALLTSHFRQYGG
jgi:pimeloyl-ACP methyl ester carboxylesterase